MFRRALSGLILAAAATTVFTATADAAPAPMPQPPVLKELLTEAGAGLPQPFLYPSPTSGCGVAGFDKTMTIAAAQSSRGPMPIVAPGEIRFQALPAMVAIPAKSDLSVAWFNKDTMLGGVELLDDSVAGIPTLSKTVRTGPGNVVATIFGSVAYDDGTRCTTLPMVGRFTA